MTGQSNSDSIFSITRRKALFLALSITFIFLIITLLFAREQFYLVWLIAPALLVGLIAVISIDRFFLLLLFLTPLSIQLRFLVPSTPIDIFLPTELMLVIILIIVAFKLLLSHEFNKSLFAHPVSIALSLSLIWMFITVFTGGMFLVSIKAFLVRLWYIAAFYLLAMELFRIEGFREKALKALLLGMTPVVIYHMVRLSSVGLFNQEASHITSWPFFNDHTSFGAALALLIPVIIYFIFTSRNFIIRILYILLGLLFLAGFVFSYSRAAWLSLSLSTIFAAIFIFRIPWKLIGSLFAVTLIALAFSWTSLKIWLESNNQDSSTNMIEHVRSIANITSDASNLERINRWKSAVRMIAEKPLTGWGPGTYQFNYAPYQYSYERTIISTNFGDRGNAHSEYLGAMVESGIPGSLLYILILIFAFVTGQRVYRFSANRNDSYLSLALMAGLFTYVIHGGLNNFLDTDKISAPFWIYIGIITILDIKNREEKVI